MVLNLLKNEQVGNGLETFEHFCSKLLSFCCPCVFLEQYAKAGQAVESICCFTDGLGADNPHDGINHLPTELTCSSSFDAVNDFGIKVLDGLVVFFRCQVKHGETPF